jgi:hypothetical protein
MSRINDFITLGGLLLFVGIFTCIIGFGLAGELSHPSRWVTDIQEIWNGGMTIITLGIVIGTIGLVLLVHGLVKAKVVS